MALLVLANTGPLFQVAADGSSGQFCSPPVYPFGRILYSLSSYRNRLTPTDPRELAHRNAWDWAAFRDLTQQVTDSRATAVGYGQNSWWGTHGAWLFGAGGGYLNMDRTGCVLNSAESLTGLDFERTLYDDLRVTVPLDDSAIGEFLNGNVGLYLDGRWFTSTMREQADFEWDVVALPLGESGAFNWLFWGAYVVNANTDYPEEAWELVWALSSADIQNKVTAGGINLPSRVGAEYIQAFLDSIPPTNNAAFLAGLENAVAEAPPLERQLCHH